MLTPDFAPEVGSGMGESDPVARWRRWSDRWNRFQENYVPHREAQFSLMIDYVSRWWQGKPVQVLDLACGPGCLAERLLHRLPEAEVVGLDLDPWLVEMGRQTVGNLGHITWVEADLRGDEWVGRLPHRAFQAVLSTTALHWFDVQELKRIYRHLATILVEDGLFLNADVVPSGSPFVKRLAREMLIRWQNREIAEPQGESWQSFWREARQEPAFRELFVERDRKLGLRKPRLFPTIEFHQDALLGAGFREFGEIWRCHESAILLAIR